MGGGGENLARDFYKIKKIANSYEDEQITSFKFEITWFR